MTRVIQLQSVSNSLEVNTSLGSGEGVRHRRRTQFWCGTEEGPPPWMCCSWADALVKKTA